jgi:hypothetical protein
MSDNDLWYVKTADGDVDRLTLDQLDEAFNAGRIDENVMVLPAGDQTWVRLGALLGADPPAPTPVAMPLTPSAFAMPQSLRPVSLDFSDDLDDAPFKKKSRKGRVVAAVIGVMALVGVVSVVARGARFGSSSSTEVAAATPAVAPAPPPPVAPTPDVAPTAAPLPDHGLSDDQKAKLAAADKARDDRTKGRKKARGMAAGAYHSSGKIKSQGFTTGGNKFDPLNANL